MPQAEIMPNRIRTAYRQTTANVELKKAPGEIPRATMITDAYSVACMGKLRSLIRFQEPLFVREQKCEFRAELPRGCPCRMRDVIETLDLRVHGLITHPEYATEATTDRHGPLLT